MESFSTLYSEEALISKLQQMGMSGYEAQVYVAALKIGPSTAAQLARHTKVPRQRIYDVLDSLANKGIVTVTMSKPKIYSVVAPRRCINLLMERIKTIESLANEVLDHLNTLYAHYINQEFGEKTVCVLNDLKDIRYTLRDHILESQKTILVFGHESVVKWVEYDLLHAQQRGVLLRIFVTNGAELSLEPVYRVQAPLPNIFIFDEKSLIWIVTPSFAVYSRCPFCANEVIKFCNLTAQNLLSTLRV
ncbi:MAG: helix-turn-helix domain-containing protein [Nitrososphaerota archaeon]|nr:helix-turn-helix domain-containing protein [Nitrososphaerota archaeon]